MRTVELTIDEHNERYEVNAISLVEQPAIEEDFFAFSKEEVQFKELEDKKMIIGLALVPDKKIPRRAEDGSLYEVIMSKETVRKASHIYLKRLHNNNTTLHHEKDVSGVSVVESWIVEDVEMDKLNLYGLKPKEGAWAVMMKVNNQEVWDSVKRGEVLGLSIEGVFKPQEVEAQLSTDLTDEELLDAMKKELNRL